VVIILILINLLLLIIIYLSVSVELLPVHGFTFDRLNLLSSSLISLSLVIFSSIIPHSKPFSTVPPSQRHLFPLELTSSKAVASSSGRPIVSIIIDHYLLSSVFLI
jgi:hypothetical protein